jgi:hypothetical protein
VISLSGSARFREIAPGGTQTGPFVPRNREVTEPLRNEVENYDELRAACDRAGLGRFLT